MPVTKIGSRWDESGYEGNLRFYRKDTGAAVFEIGEGGGYSAVNPYGAADYFVDGNASASGDGLSWATAVQSLSEAITLSNTSIGLSANRWWARRNRIFAVGDQELNEDLTVLPEKCDIIGVGTDLLPFPRVLGNHTIAAATVGVRFINMGFDATGTGDLFVFPAACHGLQFLGCTLFTTTTSTKALEITKCAHVRIINNRISYRDGSPTKIFATAISIEGTSGNHDMVIQGNQINATVGIHIVEASQVAEDSLIADNYIRTTGLTINDASGDFQVINNRLISDASDDGSGTGGAALAIKCNVRLAVGNRLTPSDHLNAPFPIQGTLS